ncbi:MAG: L-fucose/L-arabinose isomerase family protein [Candidatus Helarchaeota archaeon]
MRTTKVGICMLNDERRHVYEANNPENEKVVQNWADLLRKKLINRDGTAVEIVTGSEIVTSVRKAQKVGTELSKANCKSLILLFNVWNFPFLVWPLINSLGRKIPILCLSNNNGEFPGNVGLLATDGALRQVGLRTHRIVGEIDDPTTQQRVINWVRAAQAFTTMQNEVYGLYGGHSMGMETGYFHLSTIIQHLGCTARQIDQLWLLKEMENISQEEVTKGRQWFEKLLQERLKYDGKMLTPETLETQIRLYLAMRTVNEEKGFDFCGLKGQRELTEHVCLGDVAEMLMNDPYDWNGAKEPTVCATEADSLAAITMQILKYITGGMPTLFMDVRLYLPDKNFWDWCNSGNHASWYAAQSDDPEVNFKTITFHPALEYYFKAGGASVEFDAKPGPYTFARMGLWNTNKLYMVLVRGDALELSAEERKAINESTNPTWPHIHARLHCNFEEFLQYFPCNHVMGVAGNYLAALIYYCEIANVTPIVLGPEGATYKPPLWDRIK